ncbi:hypothetical protein [Belliella pelovolcani]|uniref:Uncharacterized protein n=1 Tax=Belliella pelovolcani TaxID=529505 RepID=A0A1N7MJZ9_9BACT|nr:hypothetical protein [Belliella pelovolcani]SIS86466.1 hypothetical protein SAMN05421761_106163 [Belliella pelovolcani]
MIKFYFLLSKKRLILLHIALILLTYFSVSVETSAQFNKLQSIGSNNTPTSEIINKLSNQSVLTDGMTEIRKLKSDYEKINSQLNSLLKVTSDSSYQHYDHDSIRSVFIENLDSQQKFILEIQTKIDISEGNYIEVPDYQFFDQTKVKLSGDFTNESLTELLKESHSNLYSTLKNSILNFSEEFEFENLFNSSINETNGETLLGFFENLKEPYFNYYDQPLSESKEAPLSKINRKVGFENIEFTEVVTQAKEGSMATQKGEKIKVGLMYNLNEGIFLSSLIQGFVGYEVSKSLFALIGGSYKAANSNDSKSFMKGCGMYVGARKYFLSNWYAQALIERNYVEFKPNNNFITKDFQGVIIDASIGLGKEIIIGKILSSTFQAELHPWFEKTKNLHASFVSLSVGFTINVN